MRFGDVFRKATRTLSVMAVVTNLFYGGVAQASVLSSSAYADAHGYVVTGATSCTSTSVPAFCSFTGTSWVSLTGPDRVRPTSGSASAIPSAYSIELASSVVGMTDSLTTKSFADVTNMFLITGPTGGGFVRYQVQGTKYTASDLVFPNQSFFRIQHEEMTGELVDLSYPYATPINFTSLLYPVQFGVPFLFNWRAQLRTYGSGQDQSFGAFINLDLSLEVFDSNRQAVTDASIAEVPEPRAFVPLIIVLLGLRGFRYGSNRRSHMPLTLLSF